MGGGIIGCQMGQEWGWLTFHNGHVLCWTSITILAVFTLTPISNVFYHTFSFFNGRKCFFCIEPWSMFLQSKDTHVFNNRIWFKILFNPELIGWYNLMVFVVSSVSANDSGYICHLNDKPIFLSIIYFAHG